MPNSPSPNSEQHYLLRAARVHFVKNGVIPVDLAMHLMRLGVSVPALEDKWGRE